MIVVNHLSENEMNTFYSGVLPAAAVMEIAEHLERCADCKKRYSLFIERSGPGKLERNSIAEGRFLIGRHLEYETLSAYIDKKLPEDEVEFSRVHLAMCSQCNRDLIDLERYRGDAVDWHAEDEKSKTIFEKLREYIRSFDRFQSLPAYAVLMIILTIGAIAAWIYFSRQKIGDTPPIVNNPPAGDISPKINPEPTIETDSAPIPQLNRKNYINEKFVLEISDNGRSYGLNSSGRLVGLKDGPAQLRRDVEIALSGGQLQIPESLYDLVSDDSAVRGKGSNGDGLRLLSPIGSVIKEDTPLLRWSAAKDAQGYIVDIVDESFNQVAQSEKITTTEWKVTKPLKRGAVYIWQVTAAGLNSGDNKDNDKLGQYGKFKILSLDRLRALQRAESAYKSRLALGILYAREGMFDDAEAEFRKLLAENPRSQELENAVRKILPGRF